jgi:hypothetical protein
MVKSGGGASIENAGVERERIQRRIFGGLIACAKVAP